jgi:hypothetical protein
MEDKKLRQISLTMKILDLKLVDFYALTDLPLNFKKTGINKDKIQFEFNVGMNLDTAKKRIHIDLNTNFYADEEKKTILGNLNSFGDFEIFNLDEFIKDFNGKIPNIVIANLIGIVLSTSRGFLILKSAGTVMEWIIMPMINLNVFFPIKPDIKTTKDNKDL